MNQNLLAKHIGCTQSMVSKWQSGKHLPKGLYKQILQEKYPRLLEKWTETYQKNHPEEEGNPQK